MFCVWQFAFDTMIPVFIEGMIIKHIRMKAIPWGNSFLVICVSSRIKSGKPILKNACSLQQLCDSETLGFGSHHVCPRYCRICVSFQFDRYNFQIPFECPQSLFHFDSATSTSFYDSGQISFLGCHYCGC